MKLAYNNIDVTERMKLIISALVGAVSHTISQAKPFNPLLGETF